MRTRSWPGMVTVVMLLALLAALPLLSACSGDEDTTTPAPTKAPTAQPTAAPTATPAPTAAAVEEFDIVLAAATSYMGDRAGNMKASDLHMRIADDDAPYIVSIRSADHYAAGHIPGAVNITFGELTTLPKDEEILIYCYTGQSGSMAAALLGVLGYDVQNLKHGMSSWSTDPDVYISRFNPETAQNDYAVETTANSVTTTYDFPVLENTTSADADVIVEAAVAAVTPKYTTAGDLKLKIAEEEDMTIVSIRSADHYAAGHVPGAINIPFATLMDNLDKIDPDSPVYVYCYTGHSSAQATALLNMLGYDAYSMKFGMCSWTPDTTVNMGACFDASTVQGYAVEK
ncbi:rhodanese-like domain-containing protein [Chloroflexota bacterium]